MPFSLTQQSVSSDWATQFDLPREGKFVVRGYITWDPGPAFSNENLQMLTILAGDFKSLPISFGYLSWIGIILIGVSVISTKPMRRRK